MADTGTSLLTGPSDDLMNLLGTVSININLPDNLNIDDNCKNLRELPRLTFVIDNVNYDLDANDYVMKIDSEGNEVRIIKINEERFPINLTLVVIAMLN